MSGGVVATDKAFYLIAAGLALLVTALIPLGMALDDREFRGDRMYEDMLAMEWLQYQSIETTGEGVTGTVGPGESIEVAGEEFTPSSGVTVEVEVIDEKYCVRGSNDAGDVSQWHCVDPTDPPARPGGMTSFAP